MKVLIFELTDGTIEAVAPVATIEPGETEQEYHAYLAGRTRRRVPSLAGSVFRAAIDEKDLPPKRFRGFGVIDQKTGEVTVLAPSAWRLVGGALAVDLDVARMQILAETRHARNAALRDSDQDKARLDEIGTKAEKAALATYRQRLRDLPAVVAAEIADLPVSELEKFKPILPDPPK